MSHNNWHSHYTIHPTLIIICAGVIENNRKCKFQDQNVIIHKESPSSIFFSATPSLLPLPLFTIPLQIFSHPLHLHFLLYLNQNPLSLPSFTHHRRRRCSTPPPVVLVPSDSFHQSLDSKSTVVLPRRFWTNLRPRWPLLSRATVRLWCCKSRLSLRGINYLCLVLPVLSSVLSFGECYSELLIRLLPFLKAWLSMASLPFHLLSLLLL